MEAKFPIMDKCDVNGELAHPIFKYLRRNTEGFYNPRTGKIRNIPWNFCKFILDEHGQILFYSNPRQSLYKNIDEIEVLLELKESTEQGKTAQEVHSSFL